MREVDYIARVVAQLGHRFPEVERRFNMENERFKRLLDAEHDQIGRILKCHLIVEIYLNRYLRSRLPNVRWESADLRFIQKVALMSENDRRAAFVIPGVKELNRVRNRFGHSLEATLEMTDLTECQKVLEVARLGKVYVDPMTALEDFTTVACTFLIVDPEIEAIFEEAFRRASLEVVK